MKKEFLVIGFLTLILAFSVNLVCAQEEDMCASMQSLIKTGHDTAIIVEASIDLGMDACEALKCAFEGGADLGLIIHGAFAAESSPDVVTSCLIEAGAEINEIENVYAQRNLKGTTYSPYEALPVPTVILGVPGSPGIGSGSDSASGVVSPSTF